MRILRISCGVVTLVAVSVTVDAGDPVALRARPGRTLVVRDKGFDEPAFVPFRWSVTAVPKLRTATFDVTYNGFSAQAQTAFQAAVDIAGALITSSVTIRVEANWTPLEGDTLGNARPNFLRAGGSLPKPGTWYPDPLADALLGSDAGGGDFDIIANFNSDFADWYFGTDGATPFGKADFVSVVLHELCHGLGFTGSAEVDAMDSGSWGIDGGGGVWPVIYDRFTEDGAGRAIIDDDVYPNPSMELGDVLQGGSLFWNGDQAVSVNGGDRPRLYAPAAWEDASSYSHLDETTYPAGDPNSLMTPSIARAEAIHDPGPITLCMFQDMGWVTAQSCESSYWIAAAARAKGVGGSQWRTTFSAFNPGDAAATVDVIFHRGDSSEVSTSLTVLPGHQRLIDDIVGFVGSTGSGSLEVVSDQPLFVASRIFNQSPGGTFGQFLDGVPSSEGLAQGDTGWLILLRENASFRTNIGFTNTGASAATATVRLYDSSGGLLTTFSVSIPAGQNVQENQPFLERAGGSTVDGGTASVTIETGSGILVYASVVDNATNDATTIPVKR